MKNDHVSGLIGYHNIVDEQMCGKQLQLNIYGEFYSNTLHSVLKEREETLNYLEENEVWYIIDSVVKAMKFFEDRGISHGDLRSQQIILTQDGNVLITHHTLVHPLKNLYLKALTKGEPTYLDYHLLDHLNTRELNVKVSYAQDIFSLGMTILYMTTFIDPSQTVYNYLMNTLGQTEINKIIKVMQKRYTQQLTHMVIKMLSQNQKDRATFQYYHNYIQNI